MMMMMMMMMMSDAVADVMDVANDDDEDGGGLSSFSFSLPRPPPGSPLDSAHLPLLPIRIRSSLISMPRSSLLD